MTFGMQKVSELTSGALTQYLLNRREGQSVEFLETDPTDFTDQMDKIWVNTTDKLIKYTSDGGVTITTTGSNEDEIFFNIKDYGAVGNGIADDYPALNTLITAIGSSQATIVFPVGTYRMGSSITIPSNVCLYILNGSMLAPDSGDSITINGTITAGIWQIFAGSGTITGNMKVDLVYPQWWGAKGDGTTDDTAAIQALVNTAVVAGRKSIFFPHTVTGGQYKVTSLTNADQMEFFGDNASFVGGYTTAIKQMGDWASTEQLLENAKKPLYYQGRGTGQNIPISTAFPYVTLAQVQSLDPGATLSDSADWYVIQKLFKDAIAEGVQVVQIPYGEYVYTRGFVIEGGTYYFDVLAYGAKLRPVNVFNGTYTGKLLTINSGRKISIKGLWLDGGYSVSEGIEVNGTQEWYFENVYIWKNFVGLKLIDTFYGEFTGECVLLNNLTAIELAGDEVNSVDLRNARILGTYPTTIFTPDPVSTYGVLINCNTNAVKIDGLVIETVDYGVYGVNKQVVGTTHEFVNIEQCYFEDIRKESIVLKTTGVTEVLYEANIQNNRFFGPNVIEIGNGNFRIYGNEMGIITSGSELTITVSATGGNRTNISTDVPNSAITASNISYTTVMGDTLPYYVNFRKYKLYTDTNPNPTPDTQLVNLQDNLRIRHKSLINPTGINAVSKNVYSVFTKPMTFMGAVAGTHALPTIKGDDGNFYMISTATGASLALTRVYNTLRLEEPVGSYLARELYRLGKDGLITDGSTAICLDLGTSAAPLYTDATLTYSAGKWYKNFGLSTQYQAISHTTEIAGMSTASQVFNDPIWCLEMDNLLHWRGTIWSWADWYGQLYANHRAIGTLAQRPATPTVIGFIYYATDTLAYSKWNGTSYDAYTPITVP